MKETLKQRCELFIQNRDIIKSEFGWQSTYMYPLCANIYTSKNQTVNVDQMNYCKSILKEKTGVFSNFRGTSQMATITILAMSHNPEQQMERMLELYSKLKEYFSTSTYLTVSAAMLVDLIQPNQYDKVVNRTRDIYDLMKQAHRFLTSSEDSTFAALLAVSNLEEEYIAEEMEKCYQILKGHFNSRNAVQSLSHVLTLGEGLAEDKCNKVIEIFDYLYEHGYKYGKNYELATLGVLAMLDVDTEILCQEIMEVDDFLKEQKGFGAFSVGSKQRLMYAALLAMNEYIPSKEIWQATTLNSVISIVIAQQVAICASIAATSAAAASASS